MSRFKAGDLAIIISARNPNNVGSVVELLRIIEPDEIYKKVDGGDAINAIGKWAWLVRGNVVSISGVSGEGLAKEESLMPLRGDFTPEQSKEQERPVNA